MERDGARRNQQTCDDFKDAKLTRHRKVLSCRTGRLGHYQVSLWPQNGDKCVPATLSRVFTGYLLSIGQHRRGWIQCRPSMGSSLPTRAAGATGGMHQQTWRARAPWCMRFAAMADWARPLTMHRSIRPESGRGQCCPNASGRKSLDPVPLWKPFSSPPPSSPSQKWATRPSCCPWCWRRVFASPGPSCWAFSWPRWPIMRWPGPSARG